MHNKYLYSFFKDGLLRSVCILSVIAVVLCLVLIRLWSLQNLELQGIQDKQAVISRIPALQDKIARMRGTVKKLTLNGIISDKARPMAVINNTLLNLGDEIEGKKVITIADHTVKLCDDVPGDKCIELSLEE